MAVQRPLLRTRPLFEPLPGIDLIYYGKPGGALEYDLVVAPGADPGQIRMKVSGDDKPSIDASGNLLLAGPEGAVSLQKPGFIRTSPARRNRSPAASCRLTKMCSPSRTRYEHSKASHHRSKSSLLYSSYLGAFHRR